MSATVSRLILSFALVAAVPGSWSAVFFCLYEWLRGRGPDDALFLLANLIIATLFVMAWILIWRREVSWTRARAIQTVVAIPLSALLAVLVGVLMAVVGEDEAGILLGGALWLPLWIGSTAMIWREKPLETARRRGANIGLGPNCPKCGYSLSGLSHARCPECGTQYTLDELFAGRTAGDLQD